MIRHSLVRGCVRGTERDYKRQAEIRCVQMCTPLDLTSCHSFAIMRGLVDI